MATFHSIKRAFAREHLTVSNTAVSLTAATYLDRSDVAGPATGAKITVETQPLRYTEEGTTPDATGGSEVGTYAAAGTVIYLETLEAIKNFKIIRDGGTDGDIEVVYYRA